MSFDWHVLAGIVASALLVVLVVPYVRSTLTSTTRPSAVSWTGWALLFIIETAAQASKGVDWSLAVPLISTFSTTIIAVIAFRTGKAVWTRADAFCIGAACIAIGAWALTQEPLTAIILAIIADLAVTIPTVVKTYQYPDSEPFLLWVSYTGACALAIAATQDLTVYNLLGPVYTVLGALLITVFARGKFFLRA